MPGWRRRLLRQLPRLGVSARRRPGRRPRPPGRRAARARPVAGPRRGVPPRAGALRAREAARPLPRAPARGDDPAAVPHQLRHRRRREPRAVRAAAAQRRLPRAHRLLRAGGGDVRAAAGLGRGGPALVRAPLRAGPRGVRGHHDRRARHALLRARADRRSAWTATASSTTATHEEVPVRRLDALLDAITADVPDRRLYLKLDTQGYDLEAFAGMGERTAEVCAMQSEVAVMPIYDGMPMMAEALATYAAAGLRDHRALSRQPPEPHGPGGRVRLRAGARGRAVAVSGRRPSRRPPGRRPRPRTSSRSRPGGG